MSMEIFFNVILPVIICVILIIISLIYTPSFYEMGLMDWFIREHPEYGIEPFEKLEEKKEDCNNQECRCKEYCSRYKEVITEADKEG